jgi:hypothetical protein
MYVVPPLDLATWHWQADPLLISRFPTLQEVCFLRSFQLALLQNHLYPRRYVAMHFRIFNTR